MEIHLRAEPLLARQLWRGKCWKRHVGRDDQSHHIVVVVRRDNGSQTGVTQGTPSQILSEASLVSGATLGTFTLSSVPAGTYNLFLYGANYDGNRGAAFTVSSGVPLGGFSSALNPNGAGGGGPLTTFVLGGDYVEFTGVTPDGSGTITGTWGAVSNPNSGLSGEGDFNGLQLQFVAPSPNRRHWPSV